MNKKILKYIEEYKGYSLTDWEKEYYSKHYPTIEKFEKDMIYQSIKNYMVHDIDLILMNIQ